MSQHVHVGSCAHGHSCPKRSEERIRCPEIRATVSYDPLDVIVGNEVRSCGRAASNLSTEPSLQPQSKFLTGTSPSLSLLHAGIYFPFSVSTIPFYSFLSPCGSIMLKIVFANSHISILWEKKSYLIYVALITMPVIISYNGVPRDRPFKCSAIWSYASLPWLKFSNLSTKIRPERNEARKWKVPWKYLNFLIWVFLD